MLHWSLPKICFQNQESPLQLRQITARLSGLLSICYVISIGNYTVREVSMKNRTRVWRNVYKD